MFITFETPTTFVSIEIDKRLSAYDDESLVTEACQQLGTDYEDYYYRESFARATVVSVDWQPVVNRFRSENVILRRKPRAYAIR